MNDLLYYWIKTSAENFGVLESLQINLFSWKYFPISKNEVYKPLKKFSCKSMQMNIRSEIDLSSSDWFCEVDVFVDVDEYSQTFFAVS